MGVEQLTFTDLPRGKGVDPDHAGYQIKACSPGLTADERSRLADLCMHYGDSVYRYAPREALDRELEWRSSAEQIDAVPEQILAQFPHIWSYHRLGDDRFALTRIGYCGLSHDGRFGNFFAHSLVFSPDDLQSHAGNPLRFARSGLFRAYDSSNGRQLPVLTDLGKEVGAEAIAILTKAPYRESVAALLSALADSRRRPVLVCLADWREAAPLVESLLELLPPSARSRTTVCTYETDRNWSPGPRDDRPKPPAHHLMVLCGGDGQAFDLRTDEYESRFAVFNFVAGQFSSTAPPRPFAEFAAACSSQRDAAGLDRLHALVEEFGMGADPDAWDTLTPAARLSSKKASPEELAVAARCLAEQAKSPFQVEAARRRLWPHVQALAEDNAAARLADLAPHLSALADGEGRPSQSLVADLGKLASESLAQGRAATAAELLRCAGQTRQSLLSKVLSEWLSKHQESHVPADGDDPARLVELLLEGMQRFERTCNVNAPYVRALTTALGLAARRGTAGEVWRKVGDEVREKLLAGKWSAAQRAVAERIAARLPPDQCPQANAWIHEMLLESGELKGEALLGALETLARASAACDDAEAREKRLAALAEKKLSEKPALAVGLGRMAEAAGDAAAADSWYARYRSVADELEPAEQKSIHLALAGADAKRVLCRDAFAVLVPWRPDVGPQRFQHWKDAVLVRHPAILEDICSEAAGRLQDANSHESILPLVRELAAMQNHLSDAARAAFLDRVVAALPMRPLDDRNFEAGLENASKSLSSDSRARLHVLRFLARVEQQASADGWTLASFPAGDEVWTRHAKALSAQDKQRLRAWCLRVAGEAGLASAGDAAAFSHMLAPLDLNSPAALSGAVVDLLEGRDSATKIICLKAFVRCYWNRPADWRDVVRALAERFDDETPALLNHLERGFHRNSGEFDKNLGRLKELLGAAEPEASPRDGSAAARTGPSAVATLFRSAQRLIFGATKADGEPRRKPRRPTGGEPPKTSKPRKRKR